MNTMTMQEPSATNYGREAMPTLQLKRNRTTPLAIILVAHVALFYLAQSGLLSKAVHAVVPSVMTVNIIAPPAPPAPPAPAVPKTLEITPHLPTFIPPLPLLATPQTEPTITVPPPQAAVAAVAAVTAPPAPPAPAPAPSPATPRTVSGVEYIRAPQPVYPAISKRLGETGVVLLRVLIGVKGLPDQVTIEKSSGSTNLDEAGRQAAMHALFKPHMEDGKPVPVYVMLPLKFFLS